MSNKTIIDLPAAGTITGAEQLELVQSGTSVKATLTALLASKTPNPVISTTDYNANAFDLIIADTTSASFTVTLPASPSFGQTIWFVDGAGTWATNNLVVNGNGSNIVGSASTLVANTNRDSFSLIYYNTPQGWIVGD